MAHCGVVRRVPGRRTADAEDVLHSSCMNTKRWNRNAKMHFVNLCFIASEEYTMVVTSAV